MSTVLVTRVGDKRLVPPVEMTLAIRGGGMVRVKANRRMKTVSGNPATCSCCGDEIPIGEQYVVEAETYDYCIGCVDWEE